MENKRLILSFQDINDKIWYIETIYDIVTFYGIRTMGRI